MTIFNPGDAVVFTLADRDSGGLALDNKTVVVNMFPGDTAKVVDSEAPRDSESASVLMVRMTSGPHTGARVMAWIDRLAHAPVSAEPEPEREFVEVSTWFGLSVGDVVAQVHPDGEGPVMVSRAKAPGPANEVPTTLGSLVEANGTILFLRHADAPTGQVWVNRWNDPWRLESIQTVEQFRVIHDAGA